MSSPVPKGCPVSSLLESSLVNILPCISLFASLIAWCCPTEHSWFLFLMLTPQIGKTALSWRPPCKLLAVWAHHGFPQDCGPVCHTGLQADNCPGNLLCTLLLDLSKSSFNFVSHLWKNHHRVPVLLKPISSQVFFIFLCFFPTSPN